MTKRRALNKVSFILGNKRQGEQAQSTLMRN